MHFLSRSVFCDSLVDSCYDIVVILCFLKCLSRDIDLVYTKTVSSMSTLGQIAPTCCSGVLRGNLKKCRPDNVPSLLFSKLLHSAAAHSFLRVRCFLILRFSWSIFEDLLDFQRTDVVRHTRKAKRKSSTFWDGTENSKLNYCHKLS